ncbi:MAG: hypothetical protein RSB33_06565 [Cetobacterium sp.]
MKIIKENLLKIWDNGRVESFSKELEKNFPVYKTECLEKFIENIVAEEPIISEEKLKRYCKNMDAFIDAEEFLVDFFKSTRTPEGDAVAAKLEDNPEEVERLLDGLLSLKKIRVKENENEFIVWYL